MKSETELTKTIGIASITHFNVTFESVSYTISVRECLLETPDRVEDLADYEIKVCIPFTEERTFLHWLRNPAFAAMQESWQDNENNCYFEHSSNELSAFMTLNGLAVVVPIKNRE